MEKLYYKNFYHVYKIVKIDLVGNQNWQQRTILGLSNFVVSFTYDNRSKEKMIIEVRKKENSIVIIHLIIAVSFSNFRIILFYSYINYVTFISDIKF
jgi:hypothetical protein